MSLRIIRFHLLPLTHTFYLPNSCHPLRLTLHTKPIQTHAVSSEDISHHVTVTTKTFMRYKELRLLISSLRRYYKDMTLLVADDTFEPENITEKNVMQYIMPGGQVGLYDNHARQFN